MNPQPPLLVIRERQSFWVEQKPVDGWFATLQAFRDGCFRDAVCYDTSGSLWPIVSADLKERPSLAKRLLPWRQVQVALRFGPRTQADPKDVVSRLAAVLQSESEFNDCLAASPVELLNRFEGALMPADIINIARAGLRINAAQPSIAADGPKAARH